MKLNTLFLKDKEIFSRFLNLKQHTLSTYAFENIYIWKKLFRISWAIIEENLCVFFRDKTGCFLYLPPLGEPNKDTVIAKAFSVMDSFNKNKEISRIENIETEDIGFFRALGYVCQEKSRDYLCLREDLASLRGNNFKTKRSCLNYFIKHYRFQYREFCGSDVDSCLNLYNTWKEQRSQKKAPPFYYWMLSDSLTCLRVLLKDYRSLDVTARVVKIEGKIKGFTFGFLLAPDTFCILYEITDLSIKGLAQFIFQQFCRELKRYKYINIMDDSGLDNLKRVKLSYHPVRLIPAYIAKRGNA